MKILNLNWECVETLGDDDRVYILKLDSRKFKRRKPDELDSGDVFHLKGEKTCLFVENVAEDIVVVRTLSEMLPEESE